MVHIDPPRKHAVRGLTTHVRKSCVEITCYFSVFIELQTTHSQVEISSYRTAARTVATIQIKKATETHDRPWIRSEKL